LLSGSPAEKARLEACRPTLKTAEWWNAMNRSPDALARAGIMEDDPSVPVASQVVMLSDRFKDVWCGRQFSETVDEFLHRLPPATTEISNKVPWIWIANPYEPVHAVVEDGDNEPAMEEEDEKSNMSKTIIHGLNMLQEFEGAKFQIQQHAAAKPAPAIIQEISWERDRTVMEIQKLAVELKCTSGKVCAARSGEEKG
jgi:hypothetical protein